MTYDELVEAVAGKLTELQIRNARRWDTKPDELEAMLPDAIPHGIADWRDAARGIIPIVQEACAQVADKWTDGVMIQCMSVQAEQKTADDIAQAIRNMGAGS